MSAPNKIHRRDAIKATAAASTIALASQIAPVAYATAKEGWIMPYHRPQNGVHSSSSCPAAGG